ncbi:MAG: tetratricopeptide repeat protein [Chitinophagaceae bacterium]|nr:tetratricopeptide repeat protein [Chitinophagaceae bacterium]
MIIINSLSDRSRIRCLTALTIIACLSGTCNNDKIHSPFDEILSQPPYASLTDSIRQQPKNDELYFRRAVLLNKNNLPEPALADFQKAWSLSKQEKYAFGVTNAWMEKRPDSAVIFLNETLKELPESYLLRLSLARAYNGIGKTEDALKTCDDILQKMPDQPEVWILQSELLQKKGDTKSSIVSLEKAYGLAPFNPQLAFDLAYKYAEDKNAKALSLCDAIIQRDSLKLFAEPYYIKGIYYSNINDKEKAIRLFDETIKRDYNNLNAYIEKGKILVAQKKYTEAFKVFRLANTIKPAFPDAWYWMGVCQEASGQKEEAKLNYEKAYALDKTFTEAKEAAERLAK